MNTKQEKEVEIVEGFFKTLGISVRTEPSDKPDVIAMVGDSHKIGVEVRRYYVDVIPSQNQSDGQRLKGFWSKVLKYINQFKSGCPELSKIHAYVKLKKEKLKKNATGPIVRDLAKELLSFVRANSQEAVSDKIIIPKWEEVSDILGIPDWRETSFRDFSGYNLLSKYVAQIDIRKGIASSWTANVNATHVGINYDQIAKIIEDKNEKAKSYEREILNELWLLIAAPHDSVFNGMHPFPDQINFLHPHVQDACIDTTFDNIFFWSSPPHEWTKQIWSKQESVES